MYCHCAYDKILTLDSLEVWPAGWIGLLFVVDVPSTIKAVKIISLISIMPVHHVSNFQIRPDDDLPSGARCISL
ncbi:hypothetical protein BDR06DRAFT_955633 [Suillus hirtellus]|nr:hypothetical protein BDR06DRAFT_955633 [Suillus hirtellus]